MNVSIFYTQTTVLSLYLTVYLLIENSHDFPMSAKRVTESRKVVNNYHKTLAHC